MNVDARAVRGGPHPDEFEFPSAELQECPFPFYDALRSEAPVYQLPGRHEYLVSRWEDVTHVAEHPGTFSSALLDGKSSNRVTARMIDEKFGYSPTGMALCDPPEHKMKRSAGLRLLNADRLKDYEPSIARFSNELIDGFIDKGEVEFVGEYAYWLPIRVIVHILGLPAGDLQKIKRLGDRAGQGARFMTEEELAEETALADELRDYLRRHLLARAETPAGDGLSELIRLQVERDGELNVPYLMSEASTLLFAGNTTTTHMLASAMQLLLQSPEQLERARAERGLIRHVIDETLRLESPVQWTQRTSTEDTTVGGVPIPAGSTLLCVWASGNRDERRFQDPERFDVDRPQVAKHQLGFGRGIHRCLGAPLARLEGEIAFNGLFDRLTDLELKPGANDFAHITVHHMRAPKAVHMTFERV